MAGFAPPAAGQDVCAANDQAMMQPLWAVNGGG